MATIAVTATIAAVVVVSGLAFQLRMTVVVVVNALQLRGMAVVFVMALQFVAVADVVTVARVRGSRGCVGFAVGCS